MPRSIDARCIDVANQPKNGVFTASIGLCFVGLLRKTSERRGRRGTDLIDTGFCPLTGYKSTTGRKNNREN